MLSHGKRFGFTIGHRVIDREACDRQLTGHDYDIVGWGSRGERILSFGGRAGKPIGQVPAIYPSLTMEKRIFDRRKWAELKRQVEDALSLDPCTLPMEMGRGKENHDD